jgi:hypothetical protein
MKTTIYIFFLILAVGIGFFAARWSAAQPANLSSNKESAATQNNLGMDELVQLLSNLQETKQTNTSKLFSSYLNASLTMQHLGDISTTLITLKFLREGRTNEAIDLLDGQLDSDIIAFAASYRDLTTSQRGKINLKILQQCYDYRSKFPHKWPDHPEMDGYLTNAFNLLNEQGR